MPVSAKAIRQEIAGSPDLQNEIRLDPIRGFELAEEQAAERYRFTGDAAIYRNTVYVLGAVVILSVIGTFWLTLQGRDLPAEIIALASTSLGALAGLLAPSPASTNG